MGKGIVAVAGASGFVGSNVVRELIRQGFAVRALVRDIRKAREVLPAEGAALSLVVGDVLGQGTCDQLLRGCDACVNCIGILRESRVVAGGATGGEQTFQRTHVDAVQALVGACERLGVARFVQVSALGVGHLGQCEYQTSKWAGEQIVRRGGLNWTILRPGLIHGAGSEFIELMQGMGSGLEMPYAFMPYFTRGETDKRVPLGGDTQVDPRVAPVFVEDVALAVAKSLGTEAAIGEVYNLVGSQAMTMPALLAAIRDGTGGNSKVRPWGLPSKCAACAADMAGKIGLGKMLPFDSGMAIMAAQDGVSETEKVKRHLGLECRGFTRTFATYAGELVEA